MRTADTLEIFVPFWGDPDLLDATIESIRAQTDPDWHVTVVDDCYPDPAVAERFARESDPRISYLRNEVNLGITRNYERCLELASAELMMFMGCDDLMQPGFVATVKAAHRRHPEAAVIQVGVQIIDEQGQVIEPLTDKVKRALMPRVRSSTELGGERLATSLLRGNWLYWPSLVFRTEVVRRFEFRDGLPIIQDLALMIDLVAAGETLALDPTLCFSYRRHTQSASSASLLHGSRLPDERRYYASAETQMAARGWTRAARTARHRWTSRLHAVTLLPTAARLGERSALRSLLEHTLERSRPGQDTGDGSARV
ncbi:glycosyltransferase family 2 protein [Nocardioides houyundeii]|uniref:glycosyltransferase family 2 protein n=1 Tax=Nocardioides houyundeii TaxID=2045452 RepID=UPI000C7712D9|nr:glycosyltransferase [Nocardioides houyundeii]